MKMVKEGSLEKLRSISQQHIFNYFEDLNPEQQKSLDSQIQAINIPTFRMQQQLLLQHHHHAPRFLDAFDKITYSGNEALFEAGKKLIAEGKVGCLVVAGGMGSRLNFEGPKGMFPISLIKQKSIFQMIAEKTLAAGKQAGIPLSIAFMTSPLNHQQTIDFFETHQFFGLQRNQIDFFCQDMLPLLDHEGNLFLDRMDHLAVGPDGNGTALQHFVKSGIWEKWHGKGIRFLNFILLDNLLADPFDAELAGFHQSENVDIVIKCTSRKDPRENVGIILEQEDKVKVIEYSELPDAEKTAVDSQGNLKHIAANLSLFSFSMDFIQQHANEPLPMHLAHKKAEYLNPAGVVVKSHAWKFERFIFDILPLAWSIKALLYPREVCFAPLKNDQGADNPDAVREALQQMDRIQFEKITGKIPSERPFELDQAFYYPTPEFIKLWKRKELPETPYIEGEQE